VMFPAAKALAKIRCPNTVKDKAIRVRAYPVCNLAA